MVADEGAVRSGQGSLTDLLLPATALVLGLQAWRVGMVALGDTPTAAWVVALALGVLPVGRGLAHRWGARRVAAWAVAGLAVSRLAAQLGAWALAPWYGALGMLLLAVAVDLWVSTATSPARLLQGLLLGVALALADQLLTDTYDFIWQGGWLRLAITAVLCAVPCGVALVAARQLGSVRLEQRPAAVAWPLVLVSLDATTTSPARAVAGCGYPVSAVVLLSATGVLVAAVAAAQLPAWVAAAARRRPRQAARRFGFGLCGLAGAIVAAGSTVSPYAALVVAGCGPLFLCVLLAPTCQSRPVGLRRRLGEWAGWAAWLLAVILAAGGRGTIVPLVVPPVLLAMLAASALRHPDRLGGSREPSAWWPFGVYAAVVGWAGVLLVSTILQPADLGAALPANAGRLASLDLQGGRDEHGWPNLVARTADLRAAHPQLVVLRGLRRNAAGWDAAWWLAQRLDLVPYSAHRPASDLAVLAPARPVVTAAVGPGLQMMVWRLGEGGLALAQVDSDAESAAVLARAVAAVDAYPRRLVCGRFAAGAAAAAAAWPDYRLLASQSRPDGEELLLAGPGIDLLDPNEPPLPWRGPGLTALLAWQP